jgi:glycosyltransferase involved in cell wall biosynthesis
LNLLKNNSSKYWLFSNIGEINLDFLPTIATNLKYSVIEYDFKYCKYRSPRKHQMSEGVPCDCEKTEWGKLIEFYFGSADTVFFMSEKQRDIYFGKLPGLANTCKWSVLSSIFDENFFKKINLLRNSDEIKNKNDKYLILNSPSWIKGVDECVKYCEENKLEYELAFGLSYSDFLDKMVESKGVVLMPMDWDTCPRVAIEAKLLDCDVRMNNNVLHRDEEWFDTDDINTITGYLYASRNNFWKLVYNNMNYKPTISGYTTTYNCVSGDFPYMSCIKSMLDFCDEVVVVDGGSDDGTYKQLLEWSEKEPKLCLYKNKIKWGTKESSLADGQQKALARSLCTKDFCWQMDSDECVHENDIAKIHDIVRHFPKGVDILSLPVVEYWGSLDSVRMDIQPWKWRLSRNKPNITHGVPKHLLEYDDDGNVKIKFGLSDGCDYIDVNNLTSMPHASFYDASAEQIRTNNIVEFAKFYNWVAKSYPTVYHFSWASLERKLRSFKGFWSVQWAATFGCDLKDTAENNVFFDKPWTNVNDDDIKETAEKLKCIGPRLAHEKIDYNLNTSHMLTDLSVDPPKYMHSWLIKNKLM